MSRVITFSRVFPSYHPRAGEPTHFIDKIYAGLADTVPGFKIPNDANAFWDWHEYYNATPKYHTIRAGHRWKVGDKFSPRIWSGKPYNSKQITFAPEVEVKKVWDVEFDEDGCFWVFSDKERGAKILHKIARNDGLTLDDLMAWFNKPFTGQIICWNENINY